MQLLLLCLSSLLVCSGLSLPALTRSNPEGKTEFFSDLPDVDLSVLQASAREPLAWRTLRVPVGQLTCIPVSIASGIAKLFISHYIEELWEETL